MKLTIVKYGDPVLRQKGRPVGTITAEIRRLVKEMIETMQAAEGIGLAAQQVGRTLQLAVVDVTPVTNRESRMWIKDQVVDHLGRMPLVLIDPVIETTKRKVPGIEGCLSFPGISGEVARSVRIKVKTRTLEGGMLEFDAGGLLGRAVQHEYDHLQGRLFIDLMSAEQRREMKPSIEAIEKGLPIPVKEKS